ncbi:MAG: GntR family transcriptional regulator [Coprococcus sp.]
MNIFIDNKSGADQISYSQIKAQIIGGDLQEDESLPSIRVWRRIEDQCDHNKAPMRNWRRKDLSYSCRQRQFVAPKNVELLREENLKKIEAYIQEIRKWRCHGLSLEDIIEMFRILRRMSK